MDAFGSAGPAIMWGAVFYPYFYAFPSLAGLTPPLSADTYKWVDTLSCLTILIPISLNIPVMMKLGPAFTCVLGNLITALFCGLLYYLSVGPPVKELRDMLEPEGYPYGSESSFPKSWPKSWLGSSVNYLRWSVANILCLIFTRASAIIIKLKG